LNLVRVFIPTTEGPVAVERITREPAAQSAVCIKRTTRVLPISAAYDAFVRAPSGVIEREFGPWDRGAFRLDVSAPIGDGESWQLGVFIAHALAAENRLAGPDDDAAEALWITGSLDSDLGVGAIGHVAEKIHASGRLIDELAGDNTPMFLFVPNSNLQSAAGVENVAGVTAAADILRHLGLVEAEISPPAVTTVKNTATPVPASGNSLRTLFTILGLGILVAGAGAFIYYEQQPVPEPVAAKPGNPIPAPIVTKSVNKPVEIKPAVVKPAPVVAPASAKKPQPVSPTLVHKPSLSIFELRAAAGNSCAAIQFSDAKSQRIKLNPVSTDILPDSRVKGLCGLEFVISVGPEERYVSAALNISKGRFVRNRGLPSVLRGNTATTGEQRWQVFVPKRLKRPLRYNLSVSIGKTPISGVATGTTTLTARHKILPQ
jgi:hypothetical protein